VTTPSVRLAATAASRAFPPDARTARPADEARWCGEATHARIISLAASSDA